MRREGRQHGWVFVAFRRVVDAEGNRRAVPVDAVNNGGFMKAPRNPTNRSKHHTVRLTDKDLAYLGMPGWRRGGAASSGKGMHKFKHDELKTYYLEEAEDDVYDDIDV
ncbi:hypothetical protein PR202_ga09836 [Eleusine coracana subsp. coracana]|uniref:Uncharacterized protein n=1 Tax=Eleusine coracana subsp. coracana TaxID=191504 RepID=A0AAV5C452_ELECO|nr:hypothetical protein QOZ80_1AG0031500 [Eleusine coracana subsp. coracana]GJM93291.1 hypothetical protein PR202_ga09836 [Eleusine coracana subsp. coracana]